MLEGLDACSGILQAVETEVRGVIVLGRRSILQVLARAYIQQREALIFLILDFPKGTVLKVLSILVIQTQDETTPLIVSVRL